MGGVSAGHNSNGTSQSGLRPSSRGPAHTGPSVAHPGGGSVTGALPDEQRVLIVISDNEDYADITIGGNTRRVSGSAPKETRRLALDAATAHAAARGRDVVVEARDATGEWRLLATAQGVVRALSTVSDEQKEGRHGLRARGRGVPVVALLAAAGLAVVVAGGISVAAALGSADPASGESGNDDLPPPPQELTERSAPPGFQDQADWALPLAEATQPGVAPAGDALAVIDEDGDLRVLDPEGRTRWSREFEPGAETVQAPLRFVADGAGGRIAAEADGALWLWPSGGGSPERLSLPAGAEITYAGGAPLITTSDQVLVPEGGRPVEVEAPDSARPLVFDGEAVLFALPVGAWQWREPGGDGRGVDPEPPPDADDSVDPVALSASADHVVLLWEHEDGDTPLVAVHDAAEGNAVGFAEAPPGAEDGTARWQAADGWGAYDSLLIDLADGTTEELPGFDPLSAAGEVIYGELDGVPVAVDPDGAYTELAGDAARPWGLLGGRAVVVAGGEVYALPPE
jgi:hypothetical protein